MVVAPDYIISRERVDEGGEATGYEAMQQLLKLDPRPDGVFCFNDPTAMGAMKAILDAGLRIPRDIAIAGSGNVRYTDFLRVPLTTVDQDSATIGARAAQLALTQLKSRKAHTNQESFA